LINNYTSTISRSSNLINFDVLTQKYQNKNKRLHYVPFRNDNVTPKYPIAYISTELEHDKQPYKKIKWLSLKIKK